MIFDLLDRAPRYAGLGKGLAAALSYLKATDFSGLPVGRIDLDGSAMYVLIQEYVTKPIEQGTWEAHRRYIDVQYLVSGRERILFSPIDRMQLGTYVPEKDYLPMTGSGSVLDLSAGFFVIFHPEDAHMPGLVIERPESVKKVVIKVAVDQPA